MPAFHSVVLQKFLGPYLPGLSEIHQYRTPRPLGPQESAVSRKVDVLCRKLQPLDFARTSIEAEQHYQLRTSGPFVDSEKGAQLIRGGAPGRVASFTRAAVVISFQRRSPGYHRSPRPRNCARFA